MGVDVHFGDKLVPGMNHAIGIRTNAKPEVTLKATSGAVPFVLTRLDTEIWKVRFLLPKDAKGELELSVRAGGESKSEKKAIG